MKRTGKFFLARAAQLSMVCLLTVLLSFDWSGAMAQRRGGSFGGGGFRSGGSFGGSRSGGSFGSGGGGFSSGRSSGSFGGGSSSGRSSSGSFSGSRSTGSSFGRSGSFGSSGYVRSTSVRPSFYGRTPSSTSTYYYNGRSVPGYSYGFWSGYSLGWAMSPPWYYWTPFHPAFYFHRPVYYDGGLYPGGFNWVNFFIGLLVFVFLFWLIIRLFSGGGRNKGVRYTTYQ